MNRVLSLDLFILFTHLQDTGVHWTHFSKFPLQLTNMNDYMFIELDAFQAFGIIK